MRSRLTDDERAARNRLYKTSKWRRDLRPWQLKRQPLCYHCGEPATDVDHVTPHDGNWRLFTDRRNLRSLCRSCHSRKTQGGSPIGCDANGEPLDPEHLWARDRR